MDPFSKPIFERPEPPSPDIEPPVAAAIPEPAPMPSSALPFCASERNWSRPKGSASSPSASNSTWARVRVRVRVRARARVRVGVGVRVRG